jgi:peptidoglycan/LPS O-acetylase OafA/YrhL
MNLLNHLARVTSPGRVLLPQIDGLRFVAIMAVIAFHVCLVCSFHFGVPRESEAATTGLVNKAFDAGHLGVRLFFAISGFILVLPFARQHLLGASPVSIRAYFIRRITRLEPPYIIHLGILFVLCGTLLYRFPSHPALYYSDRWAGYAWAHIFPSLVYANGFLYGAHPYPNIVLWSLEVEVQFYLLAPLMASIFMLRQKKFRRGLVVSLILLASLAGCLIAPTYDTFYRYLFSLAGNIQYFLTGFLLCDLYLTEWGTAPGQNLIWDVLFLAAGGLIIAFQTSSAMEIMLPWLILVICMAAFKGRGCAAVLGNRWIAAIGGMCYTIYMYHLLMISVLIRLTGKLQTHIFWLDLIIQFAVMSAAIVASCALLFVLFERPFMQRDWPARLWAALRPQTKPPETTAAKAGP